MNRQDSYNRATCMVSDLDSLAKEAQSLLDDGETHPAHRRTLRAVVAMIEKASDRLRTLSP